MPDLIRSTPELLWAAGERATVTVSPITLPTGRTLADWATFDLNVREDPAFRREGAEAGEVVDAADWELAATAAGTVAGATLVFTLTLPAGAGWRRYVLAVWGRGGAAGDACLVYPTWLSLAPAV